MKTTAMKLLVPFFGLALLGSVQAQNLSYTMTVANEVQVSPTIYQFDVFVLNTTAPAGIPLELAGAQFGLGFDNSIANGGTLTASIVPGTSELNANQVPVSVSLSPAAQMQNINGVDYTFFNCAGKIPPGHGNGTLISYVNNSCSHPGTRIGTFRLVNSVPFAANSTPKHIFNNRVSKGKTNTAVTAYRTTAQGSENIGVTGTALAFNSPGTCAQNITLNSRTTNVGNISSDKFSVYPNPANDKVNIELPTLATPGSYHMFITDEANKVVYENVELTAIKTTVNVSSFAKGVYLINLVDKDGNKTIKKISVQ